MIISPFDTGARAVLGRSVSCPIAIACYGKGYILIRESRHRGINNLTACIKHFGRGLTSREPCRWPPQGVDVARPNLRC